MGKVGAVRARVRETGGVNGLSVGPAKCVFGSSTESSRPPPVSGCISKGEIRTYRAAAALQVPESTNVFCRTLSS